MSSDVDNWMPLWIGDYLADTMHLTTEQHGAYLLLLMHQWKQGTLPDDDVALATITHLSPAAWRRHRPTLSAFFTVGDGRWVQGRAQREKDRAVETNERIGKVRGAAGRKGAEARWSKRPPPDPGDGNGHGKPDGKRIANAWQNDGSPPPPSDATTSLTGGSAPRTPEPGVEVGPAVQLAIEARRLGVQTHGSDPRLIALAEQRVSAATLRAAIEEGRRATGSVPSLGYVIGVLNGWAERATKVAANGAAQPSRGGAVIAHPSSATVDEATMRRISDAHGGLAVERLPDGRYRCGVHYFRPDGRREVLA